MMVLVRKELRDQRRGLLGLGGGLAAMVLMYSSFWPSVRDNAGRFESYLENLPDALRNVIGELSLGTPAGYLQSELFSFLGPALILVFAIGAGARSVAGEEEHGTMDLLAAAPISRGRIVLEKFAAMSGTAIGDGVILWIALITIGRAFGLDVPPADVAAATLQLVLLGIAFGAIALLLGAWRGGRTLAIAVTAALAVATFLLDAFAPGHRRSDVGGEALTVLLLRREHPAPRRPRRRARARPPRYRRDRLVALYPRVRSSRHPRVSATCAVEGQIAVWPDRDGTFDTPRPSFVRGGLVQ